MADFWSGYPVPPMRHEALYGDRIVRCFAERPASFFAMFEQQLRHAGRLRRRGLRRPALELCRHGQREAARIAAGLAARGVRAGERVLMFIGNRPEFVFVLLALQRLGAIAVPVGVREQRPGLAYIARQCGAMGVVFDAELAERIPDGSEAPDAGAARWRSAALGDAQPGRARRPRAAGARRGRGARDATWR